LWTEAVGLARSLRVPWTAHVAEDEPEREFLTRGTGPLAEFLRRMGATPFPPPGRTAARWLREEDLLDETALLVHGVGLDEDEARGLALEDAGLCLCPRSNAALGLPPPPVEMLYHTGVFLSLGTDSLASNRDLGLWGEMRAVRRLAPTVPASAILAMATAHGAMALGFTGRAGSLHPGAPARILAVAAPDLGGGDPAAYLVETPVEDRVRWLTTAPGIPDPLEEEPRFW
jgi:cytosine/adenosine deaminase-related metal-dependent hydrolase